MTLDAWQFELEESAYLYEVSSFDGRILGKFVLSGSESNAFDIISNHLKLPLSCLKFNKEKIKILF